MKRFLILLTLAALTLPALAERDEADKRTLFNEDDTWQMYSKLSLSFSEVGSDDGFWGNLEAGGLLNKQFAVGARITALGQEVDPGFNGYDNPNKYDIMFAGLALDYTAWANQLFHASLGFFIGGGQMRLNRTSDGDDLDVDLFVMEPSLNVMVNLTPHSEVGFGLAYRHADTYDSSLPNLSGGSLSGLVGGLFLRLTSE